MTQDRKDSGTGMSRTQNYSTEHPTSPKSIGNPSEIALLFKGSFDLDELPELPSQSQDEIDHSTSDEDVSDAHTEDGWGLNSHTLPAPAWKDYVATYSGTRREWNWDGFVESDFTRSISRGYAMEDLEMLREIRRHVRINLSLIELHGEAALGQRPSIPLDFDRESKDIDKYEESALEIDQSRFAIHHAGISETLIHATRYWYSLPDNGPFRYLRNWFCHSYPTPRGYKLQMKREIEDAKAQYEKILPSINLSIKLLANLLKDETVWEEPAMDAKLESETATPCINWGDPIDPEPQSVDWKDKRNPTSNCQTDGDWAESTYDPEAQEKRVEKHGRLRSILRYCYKRSLKVRAMIDWMINVGLELRQDFEYDETIDHFEECQKVCEDMDVAWKSE
ncbi:hypothetical protein BDV96DRAFT_598862 [Lophiotrema nucula]|uniref:Uncharacterized protein n=1 Tax=Lophiotrema nucula TaxID=690887 RepID=A0A6A5ZCI6_9PLEO|nr:hypothetical protein BDV96DRAFT_598862 [Lophiotrema nucula]